MQKVYVDAGMSIDGFWAGPDGDSVFPIEEMHRSGLVEELVDRTGAVVMSRRSFEMASDPDWYACNYEHQVPIHVFTDRPPSVHPREECGLTFTFHPTFSNAVAAAKVSAGERDVAIIGERSAVVAAITADVCDELYLRIVPVVCGGGERLMDDRSLASKFAVRSVVTSENVVHIHFHRATD